ncbi:alpha-methylacyl-CoA racemase-like isoform X2 [Clavelina lepadiformis]|uniref:alpha-methylacyl-CoA racemase-like isoform X2 n=1 Tax=Clavelina lepadiformis TaxID=159417 RepID=UPI004043539C
MALKGIKVLELAGLAPSPFTGMILADFGAKVIRVDKPHMPTLDTMARGKRSICVDMKNPNGVQLLRKLSKQSDVLIEPFRPGVMEKLQLGPDVLMRDNPGLVYVRLSGYGQTGPYKMKAGHDINYIATSGVLSMLKRKDGKPTPPINLVADFAGGGLMAAFGVVTALLERQKSGKGQVIDANMVEGSAYVASFLFTAKQRLFSNEVGENMLDSGAPFYDTYETKDGKYVSVGAIEPKFYANLLRGLKLDQEAMPHQMDVDEWPNIKKVISDSISSYTRDELSEIFSGDDDCVMPVLTHAEAPQNSHNKEKKSFFEDAEGKYIPAPAPRLSRTPAKADSNPQPIVGEHTIEVLKEYNYNNEEINHLLQSGTVEDNSIKSKL